MLPIQAGTPSEPIKAFQPTIAHVPSTTEPFSAVLPTHDFGTKADKLDAKVTPLIEEYVQQMNIKEEKLVAILHTMFKFLLLAITIGVVIATAPLTMGGSLVIAGLVWGGIASGTIGIVGAGAYFGVSKYHKEQMQEIGEKLKRIGFDQDKLQKLVSLKQKIHDLSGGVQEAQKTVKKLSRDVHYFVTKVSFAELEAMGIRKEDIEDVSIENKIKRLSQEGKANRKEIEKLSLLLENAKESWAFRKRPEGAEYVVIENYELFRAQEKPDARMPLTGRVVYDPIKYKADNLQEQQDELTNKIVEEERIVGKLQGKIQGANKQYEQLKSELIHEVLSSQVSKIYLGLDAQYL